jgi:hypothetical protein
MFDLFQLPQGLHVAKLSEFHPSIGTENSYSSAFFLNNTPSLFVGQIFICGDR